VFGGDLIQNHDGATAGSGFPAVRAAEFDRFTGHDGRGMAALAAVFVHHPGHGLCAGIHVRCHDVPPLPDHITDLGQVTAGQALSLSFRHRGRIDLNTTLGAAERDVHHSRLPRHQRGKGADLVEIGVLVITHAALVRAACAVVLHAVPVYRPHTAIGGAQWDLHANLAVGPGEQLTRGVAQT
jgi:hypothetical protein